MRVFNLLLCSFLAKGSRDVSLSTEGDAKTSQGPRGASSSAGGWGPHGDGSDAPASPVLSAWAPGRRSVSAVCTLMRQGPRDSMSEERQPGTPCHTGAVETRAQVTDE